MKNFFKALPYLIVGGLTILAIYTLKTNFNQYFALIGLAVLLTTYLIDKAINKNKIKKSDLVN